MRRLLTALLTVALLGAACGGGSDETSTIAAPEPEDVFVSLPSQILGLRLNTESIAESVETSEQPFVDQVGLFGLRAGDDDLLRGTLQISRFTELARPDEENFQGTILSKIGGTTPRQVRVGDEDVYITTGPSQTVFIWFEAKAFFVLTVHNTYEFPRTLLRRFLERKIAV